MNVNEVHKPLRQMFNSFLFLALYLLYLYLLSLPLIYTTLYLLCLFSMCQLIGTCLSSEYSVSSVHFTSAASVQ